MAQFFVGTSGWNYRNWRGTFYPEELPAKKFLAFYAGQFRTAEVNYTFYHLPSVSTYENWYATVPDDFRFALKLSRFITHIKRLNEVERPWDDFLKGARALKEKLGPILLQLPPSFKGTEENLHRVEDFLDFASKDGVEIAMEFRDDSCFTKPMLSILRGHETALVLSHSSRFPIPPVTATGSFVYCRFHGPREWCSSSYSRRDLGPWARQVKSFMNKGMDAYAYFNNDAHGDAAPNAKLLRSSLVHCEGVTHRSDR